MGIVTGGSSGVGRRKGKESVDRVRESLLVIGKIIVLFIIKSDDFIIVICRPIFETQYQTYS